MIEFRSNTQIDAAIEAAHEERSKALIAMYQGAKAWISALFSAHEKGRLA